MRKNPELRFGADLRSLAALIGRVTIGGLALCLLFTGGRVTSAEEIPFEWEGVERIVAIGDVHGSYTNLVEILKTAKLIDDDKHWIGGKTHLVQNGDVVDRGPDSRKCMDLLMTLEDEAEKAGGRVHCLIGNHEAMNIVGLLDLVSDEEFAAFIDVDSRRLHDKGFEAYYRNLRDEARRKSENPPRQREAREAYEQQYPLGYFEHRRAFDPKGRYGRWIVGHNVAVRINGTVFTHGDWSEEFSKLELQVVNESVRAELRGETPLQQGLAFDPDSPLQYRGLASVALTRAAQEANQELVNRVLANLKADRMVVGHTVTGGTLEPRYGGKHISIDVGILELYRGGHRIALEIEDGQMRAIHPQGSIPLPAFLDETNRWNYLEAVAEIDPDNVDVQIHLVDELRERNRLSEARPLLERLLLKAPQWAPLRYRQLLGDIYRDEGRTAEAEEQFVSYVDGVQLLIDKSPDNDNLRNMLARFCVERGVKLELAQETIEKAIDGSPSNASLKLTAARVHLARAQFGEALSLLTELPGDSYEVFYLTGLAYLGVENMEKAKAAFEQAVQMGPERQEAREELEKLNSPP